MTALRINEVGTSGTGDRLLVLLHGYGADEHDLAPITPHIDPTGRFFTICPRAPLDIVPFGAGWYERDVEGNISAEDFLASVDLVDQAIDASCAEHGLDRRTAVIIGFSQGAAMTLASALRADGAVRPAAIACLSGMMQEVDGLTYAFDALLPRILIQHGTHDPLVPVDRGRKVRDALVVNGIEHVYREYPMQHEIDAESIFDLRHWLAGI